MKILMEEIGERNYTKQVIGFWGNYVIAYEEETDSLFYLEYAMSEDQEKLIGTYLEDGSMRPIMELPEEKQEEIYRKFFGEVK